MLRGDNERRWEVAQVRREQRADVRIAGIDTVREPLPDRPGEILGVEAPA
jgi:hypothetical protein